LIYVYSLRSVSILVFPLSKMTNPKSEMSHRETDVPRFRPHLADGCLMRRPAMLFSTSISSADVRVPPARPARPQMFPLLDVFCGLSAGSPDGASVFPRASRCSRHHAGIGLKTRNLAIADGSRSASRKEESKLEHL